MIGMFCVLSQLAKCESVGVTPARPSISKSTTSASPTACSVCWRMRLSMLSPMISSRPAVSKMLNFRSEITPSPSRRSRVTPGVSSTIANRLPTKRLNSVDFPTFGRPITASVKVISSFPGFGCSASAICNEFSVVCKEKYCAIRNDGCN